MKTDRGRKKDIRDEKMQIDLMNLKYSADQLAAEELAKAKRQNKTTTTQMFLDAEGNPYPTLVDSPEYFAAVQAGHSTTGDSAQTADTQVFVSRINPDDIRSFNLNNATDRATANALTDDFIPIATPSLKDLDATNNALGTSYEARGLALISDDLTLRMYADGTLAETTVNLINSFLTEATRNKQRYEAKSGTYIREPDLALSQTVLDAIKERGELKLSLPTLGSDKPPGTERVSRIKFDKETGKHDFSSFEDDETFLITGKDLTQSQDFRSGFNRALNSLAGQVQGIFKPFGYEGTGYIGESGRITSQTDTELNTLARTIIQTARGDTTGRIFALDVDLLEQEVNNFRPGSFKTDAGARDGLKTVRLNLARMYANTENVLAKPEAYPQLAVSEARSLQFKLEQLIAETTAAVAIYDRFISTDPVQDAVENRSATSTLSRVSDGVKD